MDSDIPDTWPPEGAPGPVRRVAPVFPLPKVFLYPGLFLPLHVFEPRYRQMIEDLLDRPGWLVVSSIVAGHEHESAGAPPIYPVGGLGEIVKHTRLADGRFLVTLAGLARVRIREVESDRLYRKVEFEALQEVEPPRKEAGELREKLRQAILGASDVLLNLPPNLSAGSLADLLLQHLDLPVDQMQRAYEEPAIARRARLALRAVRGRQDD